MTTHPNAASGALSAPLVAAARLSGDESQQVFDVLLRSLAEPGTVRQLSSSLPHEVAPAAWLALALADVDVPVAVTGAEGGTAAAVVTAELIRRATDAPIVEVSEAAIVVSLDSPGSALADVVIGTALTPEDGARVGLTVERLEPLEGADSPTAESTGGTALTLSGPGVPGERQVVVHGLDPAVVSQLGNVDGRFPTGFDCWLFAPGGEVMAISRSTTVRLTDQTERTEHAAVSADPNGRN